MIVQKRGWLEITASILSSLEESQLKKTHLGQKANIDTRAASKYVSFLLTRGLIVMTRDGSLFEITERGRAFLRSYREILETLQVEDLSADYVVVDAR